MVTKNKMDRVLKYIKSTPWQNSIPEETVIEKAHEAFWDIVAEADYTKRKVCCRIAGQSGTGKTTQLLPAVLECEKRRGNNPVVIAIRRFAGYYPDVEQFEGDKSFREKTNGFALICLAATLKLLVESGYMIVFDMTLLHPDFEEYAFSLLRKHGYRTQYQIMAVNPSISDELINKRAQSDGAEGGRVVKKETSDYFNMVLPNGLEYLSSVDKDSTCFIWTAFDKEPLFAGVLEDAVEPFEKGRAMIKEFSVPEDELRQMKLETLLRHSPL